MTLAVGFVAQRYCGQHLLIVGAALMVLSGIAISIADDFWPVLLIALLGVFNPTAGDVTLFAPLEHTLLSHTAAPASRTSLFARYSVLGSLVMALGAALPAFFSELAGMELTRAVEACSCFVP